MIWTGTGLMPSNKTDAGRNDVNWLGSFSGPLPGDLETAQQFGARFAACAARTRVAQAAE